MKTYNFYIIIKNLLPPGLFWRGKNFLNLIYCISLVFDRIKNDINKILDETFPISSESLIDDWEKCLDIIPLSNDLNKRRQAVISKLISVGGNTNEYFLNIARQYDPYCEILKSTHNKKFVAGISRAGMRLSGNNDSRFTVVFKFTLNSSLVELENLFEKTKPAHVIFKYLYNKGI